MRNPAEIRLPFGSDELVIQTTITPMEGYGDSTPLVTDEQLSMTAMFHTVTAIIRLLFRGITDAGELHGTFTVPVYGFTYSGSVTYRGSDLPEGFQPEWNEIAQAHIAQAMQDIQIDLQRQHADVVIVRTIMTTVLLIGSISIDGDQAEPTLNARSMLPSIFELTGGAIATLGRIVSDRRGMFDALKRLRRDQPPRSRFGERGSSFGSGRMRFKPARSPKGQSEQ